MVYFIKNFIIFYFAFVFVFPSLAKDKKKSLQTLKDSSGNLYEIGFIQVNSKNQDPYVRKISPSGKELWKLIYENTPVDGRATMITLDENQKPYVVFTVDGGSKENGSIQKKELDSPNAFTGVFQNSYGIGGGPKVPVIARLNPNNGKIEKGTFLIARKSNGKTNGLSITKLDLKKGKVIFEVSSTAWPPGEGSSYIKFPNITDAYRVDGFFKIYYEMDSELSKIEKAILLNK